MDLNELGMFVVCGVQCLILIFQCIETNQSACMIFVQMGHENFGYIRRVNAMLRHVLMDLQNALFICESQASI